IADPLGEGPDFMEYLNKKSLETLGSCRVEPSLSHAAPGDRFQFERLGYFCVDSADYKDKVLIFNRTVTLRDAWARIAEKGDKRP
ncbi:MAG: glutamine--tRNA ligase, partial [Thermodesulfobacteriota bacterium]